MIEFYRLLIQYLKLSIVENASKPKEIQKDEITKLGIKATFCDTALSSLSAF